jgi:hypothetical protein
MLLNQTAFDRAGEEVRDCWEREIELIGMRFRRNG